jgi:hypothetical protein
VEKSKRLAETVKKLGWTLHPSVERLVEEGRIPPFDADDVAKDLEQRIAFTQRIKKVLGEAPEGCRKLPTTLSFVLFLFISWNQKQNTELNITSTCNTSLSPLDHTDPEEGDALVRYVGHSPTGKKPETPKFTYRGRDAIVIFTDSTAARLLMTQPDQAFFAMFQGRELKRIPYGQIDVSHVFEDLPFDVLQVSISGFCLVYGRNKINPRHFAVQILPIQISDSKRW